MRAIVVVALPARTNRLSNGDRDSRQISSGGSKPTSAFGVSFFAAENVHHLRDGNRTRGFLRQKSVLARVLAHDKISLKDAFDVKALRQMLDSAPGTISSSQRLKFNRLEDKFVPPFPAARKSGQFCLIFVFVRTRHSARGGVCSASPLLSPMPSRTRPAHR